MSSNKIFDYFLKIVAPLSTADRLADEQLQEHLKHNPRPGLIECVLMFSMDNDRAGFWKAQVTLERNAVKKLVPLHICTYNMWFPPELHSGISSCCHTADCKQFGGMLLLPGQQNIKQM